MEKIIDIVRSVAYFLLYAMIADGIKNRIIAVWAWRLGTVIVVIELFCFFLMPKNELYYGPMFLLILECFFRVPFWSDISTCNSCGRRVFFRALIFNRCPYCDKKYYS